MYKLKIIAEIDKIQQNKLSSSQTMRSQFIVNISTIPCIRLLLFGGGPDLNMS
jgi:hypothetical protein